MKYYLSTMINRNYKIYFYKGEDGYYMGEKEPLYLQEIEEAIQFLKFYSEFILERANENNN